MRRTRSRRLQETRARLPVDVAVKVADAAPVKADGAKADAAVKAVDAVPVKVDGARVGVVPVKVDAVPVKVDGVKAGAVRARVEEARARAVREKVAHVEAARRPVPSLQPARSRARLIRRALILWNFPASSRNHLPDAGRQGS